MINQANQYTFSGTAHDLTRVHQGWGTASVGNLYSQAQANGWRLPILVNETDLLTAGTQQGLHGHHRRHPAAEGDPGLDRPGRLAVARPRRRSTT